MRIIYPFLLVILLLIACSEEGRTITTWQDDLPENQSVYLKIVMENGVGGDSVDETNETDMSVGLLSALIYFLDENSVVQTMRTAGPIGTDPTIEELVAGHLFEDIPSVVTQVYVIGNYDLEVGTSSSVISVAAGHTLAEIQSVILDIQCVSVTEHNTGAALWTVMDGIASLENNKTYPGKGKGHVSQPIVNPYTQVVLSPIVSGLEIDRITYMGDYTSFRLEGIYINNYYSAMPLSLDRSVAVLTNHGSVYASYNRADPGFAYTHCKTMEKEIDEPGRKGHVFKPASGVWTYYFFGNSEPAPHIILKLTEVYDVANEFLGERYVTVSGYTHEGIPVSLFARNRFYHIQDLIFDNGHISDVPESDTIHFFVPVSVATMNTSKRGLF